MCNKETTSSTPLNIGHRVKKRKMKHKSQCCCIRGCPPGSIGLQGPQGLIGIPGMNGPIGPTGSSGSPGSSGEIGATGAVGTQASSITNLAETSEWFTTVTPAGGTSWIVPAGVFSIYVIAISGGGGGGTINAIGQSGQGGAGGGSAEASILVQPTQSFQIVLDAGSVVTSGAGQDGGLVSFSGNGILLTATGGQGGNIYQYDNPAQPGVGFVNAPNPIILSSKMAGGQGSAGARGGGGGGFISRSPNGGPDNHYPPSPFNSPGSPGEGFGTGGAGSSSNITGSTAPATPGSGGMIGISYVVQS